jgi:hypothetical protein
LLWWGTVVYLWTALLYIGKAVAVARAIPVNPPTATKAGSAPLPDTVAGNAADRREN